MSKLFCVNAESIGRPPVPAESDAVPADLIHGTPIKLRTDLQHLVGRTQVLHRVIDLVRYASDASPYRYIPQAVVVARRAEDVVKVLRYCRENGLHATF